MFPDGTMRLAGGTYELMQGLLNKETIGLLHVLQGQDRPTASAAPRFPTPMTRARVSKMRRWRETFHRSGTCCPCPQGGGSTRWSGVPLREMHRSTPRRKRVNLFRAL